MKKRAQAALESRSVEGEPSLIEAAATSGRGEQGSTLPIPSPLLMPSPAEGPTSPGVDVVPLTASALSLLGSREAEALTTESPAAPRSPSRPLGEPSALEGGDVPLVTASSSKLSSQGEPLSPIGEILAPSKELGCELKGNRILSMDSVVNLIDQVH